MSSSKENIESSFEQFARGQSSWATYMTHLNRAHALVHDLIGRTNIQLCHPLQENYVSLEDVNLFDSISDEKKKLLIASMLFNSTWTSPEWVFPLGFDELRFNDYSPSTKELDSDIVELENEIRQEFMNIAIRTTDCEKCARKLASVAMAGPQYRTPNGVWHGFMSLLDMIVPQKTEAGNTISDWVDAVISQWLSKFNKKDQVQLHTMVSMPSLIVPGDQTSETLLHQSTSKEKTGVRSCFLQK